MADGSPHFEALLQESVRDEFAAWVRRVGVRAGDALVTLRRDPETGALALSPEADPEVEFSVALDPRLLAALDADPTAPEARFELLLAWFWPVTWWTLRRRRARDWILALGAELDNVVHLSLVGPDGAVHAHTLLSINAEWWFVDGHHGVPGLSLRLDVGAIREWLGRAVAASTSPDDLFWGDFGAWYEDFCARHGERTPNAVRAERVLAELARYDHWDEEAPEEAEPEPTADDWDDWGDWGDWA